MVSCLRSQGRRRIPWIAGDYKQGTEYHGSPPFQLRVSRTYILKEPLGNVICGHHVLRAALADQWGKIGTHRFGYENSEDMVSWNVFRSLQEARLLAPTIYGVTGVGEAEEPELFFWTAQVEQNDWQPWARLFELRSQLEGDLSSSRGCQPTEPDVVLHFPGRLWIFIEAKFGSENPGFRDERHRNAWLSRNYCSSALDREAIMGPNPQDVPEQILRNVAFANAICERDERAVVLSLTRQGDSRAPGIKQRVGRFLASDCRVAFKQATWEAIYRTLPIDHNPVACRLRRYLANKTISLKPAFELLR